MSWVHPTLVHTCLFFFYGNISHQQYLYRLRVSLSTFESLYTLGILQKLELLCRTLCPGQDHEVAHGTARLSAVSYFTSSGLWSYKGRGGFSGSSPTLPSRCLLKISPSHSLLDILLGNLALFNCNLLNT